MKLTTNVKPQETAVSRNGKSWILTVNFHIVELENSTDDENQKEWEYESASVKCEKRPNDSYESMVAAIVRARYSADAVEAITQNYLADQEKGKMELDELQEWRTEAKRMAKEAIGRE